MKTACILKPDTEFINYVCYLPLNIYKPVLRGLLHKFTSRISWALLENLGLEGYLGSIFDLYRKHLQSSTGNHKRLTNFQRKTTAKEKSFAKFEKRKKKCNRKDNCKR